MAGKVGKYLRVLGVGVAVAAEVRASIIRADVLADDAAAGLALSLVLLRFWDVPAAEHVVFRSDEVHEGGVVVEEPHHQLVIDTFVVPDTIRAMFIIAQTPTGLRPGRISAISEFARRRGRRTCRS